jgi:hypothetical protein
MFDGVAEGGFVGDLWACGKDIKQLKMSAELFKEAQEGVLLIL